MQILIIAGGEGKRMKPLTTHKSLYQLLGKPLVSHLFTNLDTGKNKIFIVTNPSSLVDFQTALPDSNIKFSVQEAPNGMAGALIAAESDLDLNDSILVISAAKLQEPGVYKLVQDAIKKNPKVALLATRKIEKYKDGGYLKLEGDKVVAIIEKPGADNMPSPYYKLILDYFPIANDFIKYLKSAKTEKDDVYEVGLSNYLRDIGANKIVVEGTHVSIKHGHNILDVMDMALSNMIKPGITKTAKVAESAVITGDVQIDDGATIYDNVVIVGPCYIGRNVVIGNGSLVRGSCIEEGSQVGYGCEIARSYIGPGTKGHLYYVGDSIIEGNVNLSAGTVLANYRFDHLEVSANMPAGKIATGRKKFGSIIAKGTITGVNSSLMPGTVIGARVTIGSGCVVKGFIPDDSIIKPNFSTYEK